MKALKSMALLDKTQISFGVENSNSSLLIDN